MYYRSEQLYTWKYIFLVFSYFQYKIKLLRKLPLTKKKFFCESRQDKNNEGRIHLIGRQYAAGPHYHTFTSRDLVESSINHLRPVLALWEVCENPGRHIQFPHRSTQPGFKPGPSLYEALTLTHHTTVQLPSTELYFYCL